MNNQWTMNEWILNEELEEWRMNYEWARMNNEWIISKLINKEWIKNE